MRPVLQTVPNLRDFSLVLTSGQWAIAAFHQTLGLSRSALLQLRADWRIKIPSSLGMKKSEI